MTARTFQARHHGALHPGRHQHHPRGHEPARQAHAAGAEARTSRRRNGPTWPVQLWRSRISSATMGPRGVMPTRGHVSLGQLKVMTAIESCRTAALGGHVARCEDCAHTDDRLQLLPQPALPEVPGRRGRQWLADARGRPAAGAVLSTSCSRCRRRSPTSPTRTRP